jgi:peptide/nickel transport system substrate-binding protein
MDKDLLAVFSDKRFRQACSYAIDRQSICNNVMLGLAHPLYSPVTPADPVYFDPKVRQYPYDPVKAKQLLIAMGLTQDASGMFCYHGKHITFNILTNTENQARKSITTILAADLQAVGIDAKFTPISFNDLIRRLDVAPYDWQAVFLGFTGGAEPNGGADMWRSPGQDHVWWPFQKKPATDWEARIDHDFSMGARVLDPKARKKYYDDWQETLGDEQPVIFVDYLDDFSAVRNHFGNLKPSPAYGLGGDVYWNMEEIYDTHATGQWSR